MPANQNRPSAAMLELAAELRYLADQAKLISGGGPELSAELTALAAKYTGEVSFAVTEALIVTDGEDDSAAALQSNVGDLPESQLRAILADSSTDSDEEDIIAARLAAFSDPQVAATYAEAIKALAADQGAVNSDDDEEEELTDEDEMWMELDGVEADAYARARPSTLELFVTRTGGGPLSQVEARAAVILVVPSIVEVVGPLEADGERQTDTGWAFKFAGEGEGLVKLGAGRDGFNTALPASGGGTLTITSLVGQPEDPEAAEELGQNPVGLPEVPEGQHAINGFLELIEDETGERPEARPEFAIVYSREDGNELTARQALSIVNHPISAGLQRFGTSQFLTIDDGATDSEKVARFLLTHPGEIDPAVIALGAAAYRGTFNFGRGIGNVRANADMQLVEAFLDA